MTRSKIQKIHLAADGGGAECLRVEDPVLMQAFIMPGFVFDALPPALLCRFCFRARFPNGYSLTQRRDALAHLVIRHKLAASLSAAVDPSAETKAAYIGEVRDAVALRNDDGSERHFTHLVSWTATKDIMKMIKTFAIEHCAKL